ncbi:hypothetical protein MMC22_006752 [Lobaria immixta]|nr:hypothetical protein [Lobaria immixta]
MATDNEEEEAVNAPLMRDGDGRAYLDDSQESDVTSSNIFIWALTFAAAISGLLFGYDTGVISSTLVSIGADLSRPLSTLDKSLITSCTSLFALVASPVTGILADRLGRKTVIVVADVLFVIGALCQALTTNVPGMIAGRSIVGLAIGSASLVVPLYISELSPSALRGRLVTLNILFITLGQVVAYTIGWIISRKVHGWRWMVGIGAAPAFVQFGLLIFMPETPRWLVKNGNTLLARAVLRKVYGGSSLLAEEVLGAIEREMSEEQAAGKLSNPLTPGTGSQTWFDRIQSALSELFQIGGNRRALTIACLLQGLQQLCGFNSLMYFSATIFSLIGFSSPTLTSLSIAVTNLVCTVIALLIIDRVGRRRILLCSVPVMIGGLILCSISYIFLGIPPTQDQVVTIVSSSPSFWAILILVAMVIYVCGYAIGIGNIAWQQSELFPLSVRSLGSGLATATNWGSNFIVGLTFLPMMEYISPPWTFFTYVVICALGWACAWRIYPETKGLGLEEVRDLLMHGWGVKESLRRL